jgi:soluble lytic murein transglycosylase-like protein
MDNKQTKNRVFLAGIAVFVVFLVPRLGFSQGMLITDGDVELSKKEAVEAIQPASSPVDTVKPGGRIGKRSFLGLRRPRPVASFTQPVDLVKLTSSGNKAQVLKDAVYRESARYGIDPDLVFSLIWRESQFKLGAVSPKGARGPLQMLPATAARFGARNPHDPDQAVRAGVAYLVWLLDRYGGNVSLALAAYNSGEGAVDAYSQGRTIVMKSGKIINRSGAKTGIPPYYETENYVKRIADRYRLVKNLPR